MKRIIQLPGTDLQVSPVCLGGADFGGPGDDRRGFEIFDAYYAAGGRFMDTANVYGRWLKEKDNVSEKFIGKWLKERNITDMVIATKGGHYDFDTHVKRVWPKDVAWDIDSSLQALGLDCIDLYYLHRDDPEQPIGDILEMMNGFIREGKIRYLGASNFTTERLRQADAYAKEHGLQSFVAVSNMWSLAKINPEHFRKVDDTLVLCDEEELAYHQQTGKTLIAYQAGARGYFSKKAMGKAADLEEAFGCAENEAKFEELQKLSQKTGESIQTLSITELAKSADGFRLIPILGANTLARVQDVTRAMELLTE